MTPRLQQPDPVRSSERAVRRAARSLVAAWSVLLLAGVVLLSGACVSVVVALGSGSAWPLLGFAPVLLVAAGLLRRVLTGRRLDMLDRQGLDCQAATTTPTGGDQEWLRTWVAVHVEDGAPVSLSARCEVSYDGETLVLGMPVVAGLSEEELASLLRFLDEEQRQRVGAVRRAAAALAASPHGAGPYRMLAGRVATFQDAQAGLELRRRHEEPGLASVVSRLDVVDEAWQLLSEQWLTAAVRQGHWHAEPFTGLAVYLDACELSGVLPPRARSASTYLLAHPVLTRQERELAWRLAIAAGGDLDPASPMDWTEHPLVAALQWRRLLTEGVQAASLLTGEPTAASVDALAEGVRGRVGEWAALLCGEGDPSPGHDLVGSVLRATACIALLDAEKIAASWEWPRGVVLRDGDDELVYVPHHWTTPLEMRDWLRAYGVDTALRLVPVPEVSA